MAERGIRAIIQRSIAGPSTLHPCWHSGSIGASASCVDFRRELTRRFHREVEINTHTSSAFALQRTDLSQSL